MVAERRCDESDANVLEPAAPSQLVSRLSDVKEIITDLINKLQLEALPEANHKQDRDNELDLETQVETHSFKSEATVLPSSVLDDEVAELQTDFCVNSGITHADHTAAQLSTERVQQRIVEHSQSLDPMKDVLIVIQKQVPVQRMVETPQLQSPDKMIDVPVVLVAQVPQMMAKTVEIPQLPFTEKIVETPEAQMFQGTQTFVSLNTTEQTAAKEDLEADTAKHSSILETAMFRVTLDDEVSNQDRISQCTVEQTLDVSVPDIVESSTFVFQDRIQQRTLEQIIANPAISLVEQTVEMPVTRTKEKTQHVVNTHVQHVVNAIETEMSKIIKETLQRKKPIINEKINQVTKHVEIPQLQIVEKTTETSKIQTIQGTRTPAQTQEQTISRDAQMQVPTVQVAQKTVKEIRSKFEVGHTKGTENSAHARNQEKQRFETKQYQKTVEVPRVQYIDKVADITVDMQRQVSTIQAAQDIEEIEDVPALTHSEVPNIPDDDEDLIDLTAWSYRHLKERPSS